MSVDVEALAAQYEPATAAEIVQAAATLFPGKKLAFATGFGVEGCVVIDLIARQGLDVDVFTLDTGVFFPETYELWRRLEARYGITIRGVKPELTIDEQARVHGDKLWERDNEACCRMRKVEPLRREMTRFDAWITAIRRDQTADRADARTFENDRKFGIVKVNPLVRWTTKDVWNYAVTNEVPYNPLHDQGYPSIGCAPCTSIVQLGEDPRNGRWRGQAKTECGLHSRS